MIVVNRLLLKTHGLLRTSLFFRTLDVSWLLGDEGDSIEPAFVIANVLFLKALDTSENGYLDHIRTIVSLISASWPEPRSFQHDLIHAMILDKKLIKLPILLGVRETLEGDSPTQA